VSAIIRKDPGEARELLLHLANFFRKNLKRASDMASLREEIEHVDAYLRIQKARFGENLKVEIDIDPVFLDMPLPTFTLQPLVENAIKHGISNILDVGRITIRAKADGDDIVLVVEDNAGAYGDTAGDGLGVAIVDKRIKNLHGQAFGVSTECARNEWTRVTIRLPGLPREEKAA